MLRLDRRRRGDDRAARRAAASGLVRTAGARRARCRSLDDAGARAAAARRGRDRRRVARAAWRRTSAIPEGTARALRDGWFLSGDLGFLDEDGWLYFVDRKRDVIRRGGENVSSVLVEKTLREHPQVTEAAVIGVPDPVLGQEIKAFVVSSAPVTEDGAARVRDGAAREVPGAAPVGVPRRACRRRRRSGWRSTSCATRQAAAGRWWGRERVAGRPHEGPARSDRVRLIR